MTDLTAQLDAIQAHLDYTRDPTGWTTMTARFLLDLARKQQAAIDAAKVIPPIEYGIDADARFANGYNEALRRVREALEAKP